MQWIDCQLGVEYSKLHFTLYLILVSHSLYFFATIILVELGMYHSNQKFTYKFGGLKAQHIQLADLDLDLGAKESKSDQ